MGRRRNATASVVFGWIEKQSLKVKIFLGVSLAILLLVAVWFTLNHHFHLFVLSQASHALGIMILSYKLLKKKTCSGLSLKSQEATALFLAVRLYCGLTVYADISIILDFTTLASTAWVIYMIRFKLKSTYSKDLDNFALYYLVVPAAVLAILIHPAYRAFRLSSVLWAFSAYLEAIAVLPQLILMQNAKMFEPFTGLYVFALGVARFLNYAYWIFMVIETRGSFLYFAGYGNLWMVTALIAETVQSFILADFCYYYVKGVREGRISMLPLPV